MKTKIDWADYVWNPVTGCTKVSQGCKHCYAERMAYRLMKMHKAGYGGVASEWGWTGKVNLVDSKLDEPLTWWKPRRVFVNSMSDLFHTSVSTIWLDRIFFTMALAKQHTFMVLTKRPANMLAYLSDPLTRGRINLLAEVPWDKLDVWPLPNVWVGVSVEDQKAAEERIPYLLRTPAAKRFISCEPLLGPVDLFEATMMETDNDAINAHYPRQTYQLDWVICGGESGQGARPMHPDWARSLRDQCRDMGHAPFFFKQWGEWMPITPQYGDDCDLDQLSMAAHTMCLGNRGTRYSGEFRGRRVYWCGYQPDTAQNPWFLEKVGKKRAGRLLDGQEWNEFPEMK